MKQCLLALLLIAPLPAYADLLDELTSLEGLTGRFIQTVRAEDGDLLSESQGTFAVRRPGLFRWEITSPDQQLLVVDGQFLWQYDRDLETVLRREAPEVDNSPLQLLTQTRQQLERRYVVDSSAGRVKLTPVGENPVFTQLVLTGALGKAINLNIIDQLGQSITLHLTPSNDTLPSPEYFAFTPPEGVEWLEGGPEAP